MGPIHQDHESGRVLKDEGRIYDYSGHLPASHRYIANAFIRITPLGLLLVGGHIREGGDCFYMAEIFQWMPGVHRPHGRLPMHWEMKFSDRH